jgi:hypothetical protein
MKSSGLKHKTSSSSSSSKTSISEVITTSLSEDTTAIIKTKIERATEGLSPDCFNYISNKVLPTSNSGKDTPAKVAGIPACTVAYTSLFGGIPALYETTTYMIKDNKLFTFQYSTDQLKVPETLPIVQKMIDSFKLTK